MSNPFKAMDEMFELIIPDEFGRAIFLHLPFWFIGSTILWHLAAWFGPHIACFLVLCVIPSFIFSKIFQGQSLRVVWVAGLITLTVLVGIPRVYFGLLMKLVMTKGFNGVYSGFIQYWWAFLNHIQPFSNAKITWELYTVDSLYLQIFFLAAGIILVDIFYISSGEKMPRLDGYFDPQPTLTVEDHAEQEKENALRREENLKALETRENARLVEQERVKLLEQNRLEEAAKVQKALDDEKQSRIKAITGKNPWDSGFL